MKRIYLITILLLSTLTSCSTFICDVWEPSGVGKSKYCDNHYQKEREKRAKESDIEPKVY